jgi:hypothetical protein
MPLYECDICKIRTKQKANYLRHLLTQKHKQLEESTKSQPKEQKENDFICEYCEQKFSFKQSMYRHIKYRCTKNKDEDLKELVRLMNLQLQQKDKELDSKQKQIHKLINKLEININTTNIQNITLLAYKDTDISHLTDKDYSACIKQVNFCVKKLIEKIHFNPEKPENMNFYISNLKDKYLIVYDGNWNIKNKNELDYMYDEKEMMLEQWLDEEQHKYPELKEKFNRYLHNKEDDDTLNMIKEDIKLMMYNNKGMIQAV